MLHELLVANRAEILRRSREKLADRDIFIPRETEGATGLPVFLDQLTTILREQNGDPGASHRGIAESATLHGRMLLSVGVTVGQVVQDYGSICQSVTEVAAEHATTISVEEFQIFNRCLDDAVAEAVTAYEGARDQRAGGPAAENIGSMVHEMRNMVTTAMLTFDAVRKGTVAIHGSTSDLLGKSLQKMRVLLDRTLLEVRLGVGKRVLERVSIVELIHDVEIAATMEAKTHDVQFAIDGGSVNAAVKTDRYILGAAVANLVQNAFKFTRPRGHVTVRVRSIGERVLIDVEDECGGLPEGKAADLFRPFEQRSADKSGLGLGLSISMKGVRAIGGEITVRDLPGVGCVFTIDLPKAPELPEVASPSHPVRSIG